jgi:hypothetical protein
MGLTERLENATDRQADRQTFVTCGVDIEHVAHRFLVFFAMLSESMSTLYAICRVEICRRPSDMVRGTK